MMTKRTENVSHRDYIISSIAYDKALISLGLPVKASVQELNSIARILVRVPDVVHECDFENYVRMQAREVVSDIGTVFRRNPELESRVMAGILDKSVRFEYDGDVYMGVVSGAGRIRIRDVG